MAQGTRHIELLLPNSLVPARRFTVAGSDEIRVAKGNANLTGAFTIAALVRQQHVGTSIILNGVTNVGVAAESFTINADGQLSLSNGFTSVVSTFTTRPDDGWVLVAATKAAGTTTPRAHIFKNGSWTHENMSGTLDNLADQAGGSVRFATFLSVVWYDIDLAVAAQWTNELSDANVEALASGWSTQGWGDLSPAALWDFNQASVATPVEDLTGGGADQTFINGTVVSDDGPDWWVYGYESAEQFASASWSIDSSMTTSAVVEQFASASLGITSAQTASATVEQFASADLLIGITWSAAADVEQFASANWSVDSTLIVAAEVEHFASADWLIELISTTSGEVEHYASAAWLIESSFTADAQTEHFSSASWSIDSTMAVSGEVDHFASAAWLIESSLQASGQVNYSASALWTIGSSFSASAEVDAAPEYSASAAWTIDSSFAASATTEAAPEYYAAAGFTIESSFQAAAEAEHFITASLNIETSFSAAAEVTAPEEFFASASLGITTTWSASAEVSSPTDFTASATWTIESSQTTSAQVTEPVPGIHDTSEGAPDRTLSSVGGPWIREYEKAFSARTALAKEKFTLIPATVRAVSYPDVTFEFPVAVQLSKEFAQEFSAVRSPADRWNRLLYEDDEILSLLG